LLGDADPCHPSGFGAGDAGLGVFKDEAVGGSHVEAFGGGEEGFGVGFAVGVVFGADDGFESVGNAECGECALNGVARRTGDDGQLQASTPGVDVREDGKRGLNLVEHVEVESFFASYDGFRVHGRAEFLVEQLDYAERRNAAEGVEEVFGELAAGFSDGFGPDDEVQGHGVGECAVEIEEEGAEVAFGKSEWGYGH